MLLGVTTIIMICGAEAASIVRARASYKTWSRSRQVPPHAEVKALLLHAIGEARNRKLIKEAKREAKNLKWGELPRGSKLLTWHHPSAAQHNDELSAAELMPTIRARPYRLSMKPGPDDPHRTDTKFSTLPKSPHEEAVQIPRDVVSTPAVALIGLIAGIGGTSAVLRLRHITRQVQTKNTQLWVRMQ
eukprot:gnl/TRDRNA2_/TRDRNA2_157696_c0_seq1.p1 gnl/TRDRNA2_/TRDRNA2_157696_c0~~gnl/TRDRNA2_/TRDRNA2_157696_c0_seq1.p1  ORF type:complete len:188 (+),score=13.54 gnl/TRDRNA2_/TRDRNA2_157696_c0_seq1:77-640(+)